MATHLVMDGTPSFNESRYGLSCLSEAGLISLPYKPEECGHNAHIFYIKAKDLEERTKLISFMKTKGIHVVFHYIPLHTVPARKKYGEFIGEDKYTTKESERLVRLPLYYGMKEVDVERVIDGVVEFYQKKR